jgi:hypothetical protein
MKHSFFIHVNLILLLLVVVGALGCDNSDESLTEPSKAIVGKWERAEYVQGVSGADGYIFRGDGTYGEVWRDSLYTTNEDGYKYSYELVEVSDSTSSLSGVVLFYTGSIYQPVRRMHFSLTKDELVLVGEKHDSWMTFFPVVPIVYKRVKSFFPF